MSNKDGFGKPTISVAPPSVGTVHAATIGRKITTPPLLKIYSANGEITTTSSRQKVRSYSVVEEEENKVGNIWDIKNPQELDDEVRSRLKDLPPAATEFYNVLIKGPDGLGVKKYWGDTAKEETFFLIPNKEIKIPIGNKEKRLSLKNLYQLIEDFAARGIPINFENPYLDWSKSCDEQPMVIVGGRELFKADEIVDYNNCNGTRPKMDIAGEVFNPQYYFDEDGNKRIHLLIPYTFDFEKDNAGGIIDIYDTVLARSYPCVIKGDNNIKESTWIKFFANRFKVDPGSITVSRHPSVNLSVFESPHQSCDPELSRELVHIAKDFVVPFALNAEGQPIYVLTKPLPPHLVDSTNDFDERSRQLYHYLDMYLLHPTHPYFRDENPLVMRDGTEDFIYPQFRILDPNYHLTSRAAAINDYQFAYEREISPKLENS